MTTAVSVACTCQNAAKALRLQAVVIVFALKSKKFEDETLRTQKHLSYWVLLQLVEEQGFNWA